jgi:hypothetical protein
MGRHHPFGAVCEGLLGRVRNVGRSKHTTSSLCVCSLPQYVFHEQASLCAVASSLLTGYLPYYYRHIRGKEKDIAKTAAMCHVILLSLTLVGERGGTASYVAAQESFSVGAKPMCRAHLTSPRFVRPHASDLP